MTQATGYVVNVLNVESGSEVESDIALGATAIVVADSFAFNEEGGQFTIDDGEAVYSYTSSDPFTETLFLSAPLDVAISANTPIKVYPAGMSKIAQVQLDDDNEGIRAIIPFSMVDRFDDGIREAQDMEQVHVSDDSGRWEIVAVDQQIARILGSYVDGEGLPPSVPTEAPAVSPDPTVLAGSGAAVVRWPYVNDATAYDIHVSTTNSSPPDASTLYLADVNSPTFVQFLDLESRTPIPTDVDSYFAIVARNAIGSAPASAWVAGRAGLIDDSVLAVSLAVIQNVVAELVQTAGLVIGGQTWNSESGLTIPDVLNFPPNNASAASIWANLIARTLTIQNNLLMQGLDNEMSFGAQLELAAGVTNPKTKPTVGFNWPYQPVYGSSPSADTKKIACDAAYAGPGLRFAIIEDNYFVKEVVNGALTGVQYDIRSGGFPTDTVVDIARGTNVWYAVKRRENATVGAYYLVVLNNNFTLKAETFLGVPSVGGVGGLFHPPRISAELGATDKVHAVFGVYASASTARLRRLEMSVDATTGAGTVTLAAKYMDGYTYTSLTIRAIMFANISGTRYLFTDFDGRIKPAIGSEYDTNYGVIARWTMVAGSGVDTMSVGTGASFARAGFSTSSKTLTLAPASDPDGAFCYSLDTSGYLRKYGPHSGAWGGYTFWYTWYDDNATGGTHESMISPSNVVDPGFDYGRAYVVIDPPPVAQPILDNTPNKHRIYAATTSGGTKRLQGVTDGDILWLREFDGAGVAPPVANGFIGAGVDPAILRSEAEDATPESYWWLKGDGSGRMGPYKWSNTGARIDGDPTYDTGWVAVGSLGNGDSPFASGGSASLTYRRIGNIVMVRFARDSSAALDRSGTYGNFTNLSLHAAALPSSVRPGSTVQIPGRMADAPQTVVITSSGMVEWWGGVGANWASGSAFRAEGTYIIG